MCVLRMPPVQVRILLAFLLVVIMIVHKSDGQMEQWCVADEQTTDAELQAPLDWACGKGRANCTNIQVNQPCYLPNTLKDHASYAFNSYYQKSKHKGASHYFNGTAVTTELDPSHKLCHYEFSPPTAKLGSTLKFLVKCKEGTQFVLLWRWSKALLAC